MQVKLYQHLFKVKIMVMKVQLKSMEQGIYMKSSLQMCDIWVMMLSKS